jgi:hypothetical protein
MFTTMANNLIPFPASPGTQSSPRDAGARSRATFRIGGRRYALEFSSSVVELNPAGAQVIPINQTELKQNRPAAGIGLGRKRNP